MNSRHVSRRVSLATASVATLALLVAVASSAQAATAVDLGDADSFVVLAGTGVTNTGPTTLNGDIGTFPTTSITDLGTITINGTNHAGDEVTQDAKTDLTTAYKVAAGQGPTKPIAAGLDGLTLVPGVYNSGSQELLSVGGVLTLDAQNIPDAVWIFQAGSDLIAQSDSVVSLINGASSCNVFWQVGSSATLGTDAEFIGTIMALKSITLGTGATVQGRVLAQTGTVTLKTNTITNLPCVVGASVQATPAPSTTPAPPQVTAVPAGPFAGGDGSTSQGMSTGKYLLLGVLVVTAAGAMGAVAGMRRKQNA